MKNKSVDLIEFLHDNVKPAAGCTEVGAIGYTAAYASDIIRNALGIKSALLLNTEKITKIDVVLDTNLYKNSYSVAIPNSNGLKGPINAAALGLLMDISSSHPLAVFEQINDLALNQAKKLIDKVVLAIDKTHASPYIRFSFDYDGHDISVILSGAHDKIVEATVDGDISYSANAIYDTSHKDYGLITLSFEELLDVVRSIGKEEEDILQETIDLNILLAKEGLSNRYGFGIVEVIQKLKEEGYFSDNLLTAVKLNVAAAVEARMGGSPLSAMSSSGSGNMGLTATLPIIVIGNRLNIEKRKILEAILLSHIIVHLVSVRIGHLSALCGANNKSAFGAAAGIAYLFNGTSKMIQCSINVVASNIIGSTCDGAKYNCTLKAMSSASIALECALFCTHGMKVDAEGIVDDSVFSTLQNLSKLSHTFTTTDDVIVSILENKKDSEQ